MKWQMTLGKRSIQLYMSEVETPTSAVGSGETSLVRKTYRGNNFWVSILSERDTVICILHISKNIDYYSPVVESLRNFSLGS